MSEPIDSTTLPCGRDLLDLVEQVTDGTPPVDPAHQAQCEYCLDALQRIRDAETALQELAETPVKIPRGIAQRVIAELRREADRVPLGTSDLGSDTVSEHVVAQLVRRAARRSGTVRHCSVGIDPVTGDGALALTIRISVVGTGSLPELAERIRRDVATELETALGLRTGPIQVIVEHLDP